MCFLLVNTFPLASVLYLEAELQSHGIKCVCLYMPHAYSHMYVHIVPPLSLLIHTWYQVGATSPSNVRMLFALQPYQHLLESLPFWLCQWVFDGNTLACNLYLPCDKETFLKPGGSWSMPVHWQTSSNRVSTQSGVGCRVNWLLNLGTYV